MDGVRSLISNHELLIEFTRRNIMVSNRGSYLGLGWIVIMPLMMMLLYSFVFGVVFGGHYGPSSEESGIEYALGIFLSLTVFQVFAEPMSSSAGLVANSPTLVKKVVFPLEILPAAQVAAQGVRFFVSLVLVLGGAILFSDGVQSTWLWFPLVILPLGLLSLGTAWLFSAVGVFVRDLAVFTRVLSTMFLFGSGVFFSIDRVPEAARWILGVNPLLHLLEQSRRVLLWGEPPDFLMLAYATATSCMVCAIGLYVFQHFRDDFADVI